MRYIIFLVMGCFAIVATANTQEPNSLDDPTNINYATVAEALEDLKNKVGVEVRSKRGWTIVSDTLDENYLSLWSFTPENHAAYPAVVKRTVYFKGSSLHLKLSAKCEADKISCDKMVAQFAKMHEKTVQKFAK